MNCAPGGGEKKTLPAGGGRRIKAKPGEGWNRMVLVMLKCKSRRVRFSEKCFRRNGGGGRGAGVLVEKRLPAGELRLVKERSKTNKDIGSGGEKNLAGWKSPGPTQEGGNPW